MSPGSLCGKVQCLSSPCKVNIESQDDLRVSIWDQVPCSFHLYATKLIKLHRVHSAITEKIHSEIFIIVSFVFTQVERRKHKALFFLVLLLQHPLTQRLRIC